LKIGLPYHLNRGIIWRVESKQMEEKITIIEGPPPTFEIVFDGWALSLDESPALFNVATTKLRTYKGDELVERCYRAWRNQSSINLEFRDIDGLNDEVPILAARTFKVDEGQMLILWVRVEIEDTIFETDSDDIDDSDEDLNFPEL
jgi:hypothetical protein